MMLARTCQLHLDVPGTAPNFRNGSFAACGQYKQAGHRVSELWSIEASARTHCLLQWRLQSFASLP